MAWVCAAMLTELPRAALLTELPRAALFPAHRMAGAWAGP
jgi:hypothetical protein